MTTLAVTEARQLTRAVSLSAGAVLAVALCTVWSAGAGLTWQEFAADSGRASLVLAGALVLLGHLAASRDQRNGAAEFTGALPTPRRSRMVALLAFVPVAGSFALLAEGAEMLAAGPSRLSGGLDGWLLVVPVLIPMIGAAVGVAAGTWWPSTPAGPLALFACAAFLAVLPVLGSGPRDLPWLLFPVVVDASTPAGWHVLYLIAALALFAGTALGRYWRLRAAGLVAIALVTAVVAVHLQQP